MKLRTRIRLRYTRLRSARTRAEQMRQVVSETHPDDLRERIAEAVHGLAVEAPIGVLNGRDSRAVADAVIRELGNVVNEHGAWGVIDLLIEIAGPRCTADERNRP